jgi:hypothetical protein
MAAASAAREDGQGSNGWRVLLRPKWLCWHAFAAAALFGMFWLGRWQLRRALSGNELSWACTVEWPLFAICGVYFWVKTIREELRAGAGRADPPVAAAGPEDEQARRARLLAEVRGHGRWHGWR